MTDPVADLLTRIRNAAMANHKRMEIPVSQLKREVVRVLGENGYIRGFAEVPGRPSGTLIVKLRYTPQNVSVITGIERVSRPGLRRYAGLDELRTINRRLGTVILSTSRGVMTGRAAQEEGVGGEVLCRVW